MGIINIIIFLSSMTVLLSNCFDQGTLAVGTYFIDPKVDTRGIFFLAFLRIEGGPIAHRIARSHLLISHYRFFFRLERLDVIKLSFFSHFLRVKDWEKREGAPISRCFGKP